MPLLSIDILFYSNPERSTLDDTDPVGNIEGIEILGKADVGLLESTGGDEGVDLVTLDAVEVLDGGLDLSLVGLDVDDEDESIGVLDELHGRFGGEGVLDDGELVEGVLLGGGAGGVLGLAGEGEGVGAVEVDLGVNSGALLRDALLEALGDRCCLGCSLSGVDGIQR